MRNTDTIFAIASGGGRAAVKVVRISGSLSATVAERLGVSDLIERRASLRKIRDPALGETLDQCLVLWFPGPRSYTGEDSLELHIHGGRAVESAVCRVLGAISGCRMSEPGEFTWRAFSNGKMDLSSVEGLADLIDADTEQQRKLALGLAEGELFRRASIWREKVIGCLGLIEAAIDFEDEGDAPKSVDDRVSAKINELILELEHAVEQQKRAEITREGYHVVIAGPPNAGKSSLMNAIARRDVSIVSPIPGTTRDLLEVTLDLDGVAVVLSDTAGIRETNDEIERLGVAKSRGRAERADLLIWLSEGPLTDIPALSGNLSERALIVRSKADLLGDSVERQLAVSTVNGKGVTELLQLLSDRARAATGCSERPVLIRARHRLAVESAVGKLRAINIGAMELECVSEDLRQAADDLSALFGVVGSEDILDEVFSKFCMGK